MNGMCKSAGMGGYTSTTRTVDGLRLIIIHWLKNIQAASELEFGGGGGGGGRVPPPPPPPEKE